MLSLQTSHSLSRELFLTLNKILGTERRTWMREGRRNNAGFLVPFTVTKKISFETTIFKVKKHFYCTNMGFLIFFFFKAEQVSWMLLSFGKPGRFHGGSKLGDIQFYSCICRETSGSWRDLSCASLQGLSSGAPGGFLWQHHRDQPFSAQSCSLDIKLNPALTSQTHKAQQCHNWTISVLPLSLWQGNQSPNQQQIAQQDPDISWGFLLLLQYNTYSFNF